MLRNYFKTAWRNLLKNKVFSLINILGLTLGITVCMMIFLFIMNEFSVDKFHKNGDRIYRVLRGVDDHDVTKQVSYLSGPYAPALLNDFKGQIEKAVRVSPTDALVTIDTRSFHEKKVYDVDSDFFELFSFPLIKGNPRDVLTNPNSVVLTESTAKKYFGSIDAAMGKTIELDKQLPLKVTGVAKDVPSNSHLYFDLVVPLSNYAQGGNMTVWINNGLFTYVQLAPGASAEKINRNLPAFMQKYMGSDMKKFGFHFSLSLEPLHDVYFADTTFDAVKHGSKTVVMIFLSIAVLILLIACINFMNLSTIRAVERSREVGLRKTLGALRSNLVWQFIGESIMVTTISCLLAIGLLMVLMPWYDRLLGYQLGVSWTSPQIYLFLVSVIFGVGILAGCYPAFFLSAFSPIQAIKGKLKLGKGGSRFRQALVVVQFTISVFLIVGVLVVTRQMSFVRHKELGYDREQVAIVPIDNNDVYNNMTVLKHELEANANIQSVSMMSGEPGGFFDMHMFDVEGQNARWKSRTEFADFEYVKTLGLKVVAGRDLSSSYPTDTTDAVLINRTAAKDLGWTPEQAIGKWIMNTVRDSARRHIVGVVEDFNFLSLKENIEPLVISPAMDRRVIAVKIKAGHLERGVAAFKTIYASIAPMYPFEYSFLDDKFDELYKKDLRQQTILTVFAVLAIFVASLGLLGLASFAATRRFKEIGVRKVLGSSVSGIVWLLSRDLLKPVVIATWLALPTGYLVMNKWLQNFAFKTSLSWWIFLAAAVITFGIAFLTVFVKAIGAAVANPVQSLRTE